MIKKPLLEIFNAALGAVDPYEVVQRSLRFENDSIYTGGSVYDRRLFPRIIVIGAGKATARMALAAEEILGDAIEEGVIVVKYGHTAALRKIEQIEAAHPVPDEAGLNGTLRILELVRNADEKTLILCLLSGGGSSLLVAPAQGITLQDKQEVTDLLLKAGAPIGDLNTVRKHLSAVKGGRTAQAAHPASVVTMILSDVIGDRLDVIASGPTAPDQTTFSDATSVIERYGLKQAIPERVSSYLERGVAGQERETAKSGEACFKKVWNVVGGGISQALAAARQKAGTLGYAPEILSAELEGEAREAGNSLARSAISARDALKPGERRCLLSGGETTVTVHGKGIGGRNQELALAFAMKIAGIPGITMLSAGTDGTDGPTDAAGAIVDGATATIAAGFGIHPEAYLGNNDSYTFFKKLDGASGEEHHFVTGPTGTNVMDLQIILLEG